jgi:hypothetical protein
MRTISRRSTVLVVGFVAAVGTAIPVWAASPAPTTSPSGQSQPEGTAKPDKSPHPGKGSGAAPGNAAEPDEAKNDATEVAVSAHGTVQSTTDADGHSSFTLTDGAETWDLSDGPPWFWGDKDPLKAYVGKTVTVAGTTETGATEIDVETVDGTALRAPGKPPWAGGPWVVGPKHPGWKSWMTGGKPGKGAAGSSGKTQDDTSGG